MNQSINTDSKNSKEPQQKYRLGTVSIKILGGLKPVLQAPNLALSFYHGSKQIQNLSNSIRKESGGGSGYTLQRNIDLYKQKLDPLNP